VWAQRCRFAVLSPELFREAIQTTVPFGQNRHHESTRRLFCRANRAAQSCSRCPPTAERQGQPLHQVSLGDRERYSRQKSQPREIVIGRIDRMRSMPRREIGAKSPAGARVETVDETTQSGRRSAWTAKEARPRHHCSGAAVGQNDEQGPLIGVGDDRGSNRKLVAFREKGSQGGTPCAKGVGTNSTW